LINRICDYALTAGYVDDSREIYGAHVKKAVKELKDLDAAQQKQPKQRFGLWRWLSALALAFLVFCGMLAAVWYFAPEYLVATLNDPLTRPPKVKTFSIKMADEPVGPENALPSGSKPLPASQMQPDEATEPNSAANTALTEDVYIIRVASFRSMQRVEKAMAQLRRQGVDSYWEMVDLGERGKWFGVYTGRFKTLEAAKQFKQDKALFESIIEHRYPEQRLNAQTPGISKQGTP
jgi:cell division septation protein DedD